MPWTVNASSSNPVSTAEAKTHLRVLHTDEDTYIGTLLDAATAAAEAHCKRSLVRRDVTLKMERFPGGAIEVEDYNPVRSITSIVYLDSGGSSQALSTGDFNYEVYGDGSARIYPAYTTSWPAVYGYDYPEDNVRVRMQVGPSTSTGSGHGTTSAPTQAVQAIKLTVGDWYHNRENVAVGTVAPTISMPFAAQALLDQITQTRV